MLEAVIFDFDGVIADSEPLHCQAFLDTLSLYGIPLHRDSYYTDYLGYSDIDCMEVICRDFSLSIDDETIQKILIEKTERFEKLIVCKDPIIEGVTEFVNMLYDAKLPLAICSGALLSDIQLMLKNTSIKDMFQVIVTADDVTKGKPDPEGFVMALTRLNDNRSEPIKPSECIVIEDSFWGLDAAGAAGMKSVAVTNTYDAAQLDGQADLVTDSLGNLKMADLQKLS